MTTHSTTAAERLAKLGIHLPGSRMSEDWRWWAEHYLQDAK